MRKIVPIDIKDYAPSGCQIEYTRLVVNKEEWFTFGLEWFGTDYVEMDEKTFEEILKGSKLEVKDSMGYNEFLNTQHH